VNVECFTSEVGVRSGVGFGALGFQSDQWSELVFLLGIPDVFGCIFCIDSAEDI